MMMDDAKTLGTGTLRDLHNVGKSVPYTKFRQMKSTLNCVTGNRFWSPRERQRRPLEYALG